MKPFLTLILGCCLVLSIFGCEGSSAPASGEPASGKSASEKLAIPPSPILTPLGNSGVTSEPPVKNFVFGQAIYVPAYSFIYHGSGDRYLLSITLSIRNTSSTDVILVRSVQYFNSAGALEAQFASGSLRLAPMATAEFFIPEHDPIGGSGANFVVEWVSEKEKVSQPIIEAVMISTRSQQGISFLSTGRVIGELRP